MEEEPRPCGGSGDDPTTYSSSACHPAPGGSNVSDTRDGQVDRRICVSTNTLSPLSALEERRVEIHLRTPSVVGSLSYQHKAPE